MGILGDIFKRTFEKTPKPEEMGGVSINNEGADVAKPETAARSVNYKRAEKPARLTAQGAAGKEKLDLFSGKLYMPIKKLEEKAKEARDIEIPGVHWSRQKEARVEAVHNLVEKFYQKRGIKSEFIKPADLKRAMDDFTEKELGEIKRKGTHNEIEQAKKTAQFLSQFINYGA